MGFSFGAAIEYLKRGRKVSRAGWNGKNQYIQLASAISYKTPDGEIVNCEHDAIGNQAIAFVGTSGKAGKAGSVRLGKVRMGGRSRGRLAGR